jgi:hypothetical protein
VKRPQHLAPEGIAVYGFCLGLLLASMAALLLRACP